MPMAPRPSLRTVPAVTTRHWSQRHRLMRGEVRWSVAGEAAVMPGGTLWPAWICERCHVPRDPRQAAQALTRAN
jgi:hypothetical protein